MRVHRCEPVRREVVVGAAGHLEGAAALEAASDSIQNGSSVASAVAVSIVRAPYRPRSIGPAAPRGLHVAQCSRASDTLPPPKAHAAASRVMCIAGESTEIGDSSTPRGAWRPRGRRQGGSHCPEPVGCPPRDGPCFRERALRATHDGDGVVVVVVRRFRPHHPLTELQRYEVGDDKEGLP